MIKIKPLSRESFAPFGKIIEPIDRNKIFDVVAAEPQKKGWRIGYLVFRPQPVDRLEAHPESFETFEPVCGTSIMIVAKKETPEDMHAFLLDKPILLDKGTWHAISVISAEAEVKITEDYEVESVYYDLKKPIDISFS